MDTTWTRGRAIAGGGVTIDDKRAGGEKAVDPVSKAFSNPIPPSVAAVEEFLQKWGTLEKYRLQESSLTLLFQSLCPRNETIEHVLLKVSALNDFYSTNIYDTHSVARHIRSAAPDDRIASGDLKLVNELAKVTIRNKVKNFYSFASKYCNHHQPEKFPIYDSYVDKMLVHFKRKDQFASFLKPDLKRYDRFVEIIKSFQRFYSLEKFTLRQLDIYLWLAGKEAFKGGSAA